MNLRALGVAVLTLAVGLLLFNLATGPVRGLFGDVLIIVFGVAVMATVGLFTPGVRIGGMLALGVAAEAFQAMDLVGPDSHWLLHLTVGSTADPLDLLAYAVGAALCVPLEGLWRAAPPAT